MKRHGFDIVERRSAAEHGELVRVANGQPLLRVSYSPACKAGAPS
jgi:hypothetical protein